MIKVFCDHCGNLFETISPSDIDGKIKGGFYKFRERNFLLCPECEKEVYEFIINPSKKVDSKKNDTLSQMMIKEKFPKTEDCIVQTNFTGKALKELTSRFSSCKNENEDMNKTEDDNFYKWISVPTFGGDGDSWEFSTLEETPKEETTKEEITKEETTKEAPSLHEALDKLDKIVGEAIDDMPLDASYTEMINAAVDKVNSSGIKEEIMEALRGLREEEKVQMYKNRENGVF
jgi:hypothetical protein